MRPQIKQLLSDRQNVAINTLIKVFLSRFLLFSSFCLGVVAQSNAASIEFRPNLIELAAGETVVVEVVANDVPESGLAAFQFELSFDPSQINLLNPNRAYSFLPKFVPLGNNDACTFINRCTDSDWMLVATGRTPTPNIISAPGKLNVLYGSSGVEAPASGSGVIALIEVEGVSDGSQVIKLSNAILADNRNPPQSHLPLILHTLSVEVGQTNQAPTLASVNDVSINEGDSTTVTLLGSDDDAGTTLTYSASGLPTYASLTGNTISIAPGYDDAGSVTVTVTVSDGELSVSDDFNIVVGDTNRAPTLIAIDDVAINEGETASITLLGADDDTGTTLTYSATGLPSYATLTGNTISIAPGYDDAGSATITVTVSDGELSASDDFNIVVGGTNRAPTLTAIDDVAINEGDNTTVTLVGADDDTGTTLTYSATGLPGFAVLTGNTITIAPGFEDAGSTTVTVTVSDGELSASDDFNIVVGGTNRAPTLAAVSDIAINEGDNTTITLVGADDDTGTTLTYSAAGLPSYATLTANTISIEPGYDDAGSATITVTVSDGELNTSDNFTVVVGGTNRAPTLMEISDLNLNEGDSGTITLIGLDEDSGTTLSYSATGLPVYATLTGNKISIDPGFEDAGTTEVRVTASDGELSASDIFIITVGETNRAPTLASISDVAINEGETASITLIGADDDAGTTLSYSATGLPSYATLTGNIISIEPSYEGAGSVTVTVTVSDGELSTSDDFEITVTSINHAPILAFIDNVTLTEGDNIGVTLVGSDIDSSDDLTFIATGLPSFATLSGDLITIEPAVSDEGSYFVSVTVSDGELSASQDFEILVEALNIAPIANAGSDNNVQAGNIAVLDGSASSDTNGQLLTFEWVFQSVPSGSVLTSGDIVDSNVSLAGFIPDVEGMFTLILTVSDGEFFSTDSVNIYAYSQNVPPEADAGDDHEALYGEVVFLDASGSTDVDNSSEELDYLWTLVATPSDSDLVESDIQSAGSVVANVYPDVIGEYVFKVTVSDGQDSGADQIIVLITEANIAPVASAGDDQITSLGDTAYLIGTSSDPDFGPEMLSVEWHFVELPLTSSIDDSFILSSLTNNASFVPDMAGEYIMSFQVSDGDLTSSDQMVITVEEAGEAPFAPENVQARAKRGRVTMVWDAGDQGTVFRVYKRSSLDADFSEAELVEGNIFYDMFTSGVTSIEYYVVAENSFGSSEPSGVVLVTPRSR